MQQDLNRLKPTSVDISESLYEIQDIGLPSILEVLQVGIGAARSKRSSTLTEGFRSSQENDFIDHFESLTYQHRMHPDISSFSREIIYKGHALKDANTIEYRDRRLGWNFGDFRTRRAWAHVMGREKNGENLDEIRIVAGLIHDFITWAKDKGKPDRDNPSYWEVACLSFYLKQEKAISHMLQKVTGDDRKTRFTVKDAPIEIVCGTVDRFQGREADLVVLSMRNNNRIGFLDSPNRLNVAVTRARQQLVIVGNADYFGECGVTELEQLANRTTRVDDETVRRWRRKNS